MFSSRILNIDNWKIQSLIKVAIILARSKKSKSKNFVAVLLARNNFAAQNSETMIKISEIGIGSVVRLNRPYRYAKTDQLIKVDNDLYELINVDPHIASPVSFSKNIIENVLKRKLDSTGERYELFAHYRLALNTDNTVELQEYNEFILSHKQGIKYLHELQDEFFKLAGTELPIELVTVLRTLYNQDGVIVDQMMRGTNNLFRLRYKDSENYSYSLTEVVNESGLAKEQKERVKNDLDMNGGFFEN